MKANKFAKNDEGVSAVIGVILMVAITVILAAVIAAFVFGMVGGVQKKNVPLFTIKKQGDDSIQVTLQDANGASEIKDFAITSPEGSTYTYSAAGATSTTPIKVGDVITATNTGNFKSPCHVTATALVDGTTMVVLDVNV